MDITDADRAEAQADAEASFPDTCRITVGSGWTTDPDTGEVVPNTTTIYPSTDYPEHLDGKCKFQSAGAGSTPEAGGFQFTVVRNEVHVPFGVAVPEDAVVECLTSNNQQLVGEKFRVTGFAVESYATAARIPVESV